MEGTFTPYAAASAADPETLSIRLLALNMSFFGTQPTFTQVPPMPDPFLTRCPLRSVYVTPRSTRQTLAPYSAARRAQAEPPDPPPITRKS